MRNFIIGLSLLASASLQAETLTIPVGSQGAAVDKPGLGHSMSDVRKRYGEPQQISPPIGEPPISRWDYPQFTVYFENTSVLHSVTKHKATAPKDSNQ